MKSVTRKLRLRMSTLLFVLAMVAGSGLLAADRFVSGIADLPLMPGLEEIKDSAVVFSKPQGRIVEVMARGAVTRDRVQAFYNRTLPQLGWRRKDAGTWHREGELLQFDMRQENKELVIQFSLMPR